MFGFLNPRPHSADYRRAYARLCQHQRVNFGIRTLPFHSYEAVFLYQLAIDLGAFPSSVMPHVRCCKLHHPLNIQKDPDAAIGKFCSAVGVLLASIKVEDDVLDSKGFLTRWSRRILQWVLGRKFHSVRKFFAEIDPKFERNVHQLIADHHRLEQKREAIPLAEYVEPTGLAFGYVFSRLAKLNGLAAHERVLSRLGTHVGKALIAFDCAIDWKRDGRRGEFNPLMDESDVESAMVYCLDQLRQAESFIRNEINPTARSAMTLLRVQQRLLLLNPLAEPRSCPTKVGTVSRKIALPVYASSGTPGEEPAIDGEQPVVANGEQPVENAQPPELPGGVTTSNKQNTSSSCCSNNTCDNCCEISYCGCMSADCLSSCGGAEACCAIAECGDCSC